MFGVNNGLSLLIKHDVECNDITISNGSIKTIIGLFMERIQLSHWATAEKAALRSQYQL